MKDLALMQMPYWIIDSGATYHISSKLFSDKHNKCTLPPVLLPSGEKAKIVTKGLFTS